MLHSLLRSAGGDYNNRKCSRAETFCCNSAHHARNASAEQEAEITCCWKCCPSWTCGILQNGAVNKHRIFSIEMDCLVCWGLAVGLQGERNVQNYIWLLWGGFFVKTNTLESCVWIQAGRSFLFFSQNLWQYYNMLHSPSSPGVPYNHHHHQPILKDLRELAIKQAASQSLCT